MEYKHDKMILLLGVSQRSGTNYLNKLILNHPNIIYSKQPSEDFIIQNSQKLLEHVDDTVACWNEQWEGMDKSVLGPEYLNDIRQGLVKYLQPLDYDYNSQYFLSKTPSVIHLGNVTRLFPEAKIVLLMRYGKNVIESGVKGFGWTYKEAMKNHQRNSEIMMNFLEKNKNQENIALVKYEELTQNTKPTLQKMFSALHIDDANYDYTEVEDLPIYGSSFKKDDKNRMVWDPIQKDQSFKPNKRAEDWNKRLNKRYEKLCAKTDAYFGY